ncbi:MAG: protein-glutamate O-methyltransferase CheR [Dehalococcoidia bacterium]
MNDLEYAYLKRRLAELFDVDIGAYKAGHMRRRLETFIAHHGDGDPIALIKRADRDDGLRSKLRRTLTISVSSFFRDPGQYALLRSAVLPDLLGDTGRLQVWSAACSRGQEPYSLAMVFLEMGVDARVRILATDIDEEALAVAREGGPYTPEDVGNVSRLQMARHFVYRDGHHWLTDEVKRGVEFGKHDLIAGVSRRMFGLIACRNVLIYFEPAAKSEILRKLHRALAPGGVLFVGAAEAPMGEDSALFESLGGNFYRKRDSD